MQVSFDKFAVLVSVQHSPRRAASQARFHEKKREVASAGNFVPVA
jgi:hypothetical protein